MVGSREGRGQVTIALAPTLRPYQRDALAALTAARARGRNRLLYKSPTGTGKTVTFAQMPTWPGLVPGVGKMLVIAHREELLDQAAAKIQAAQPGRRVEVEQADRVATRFADIVIASIQTLAASKFRRLHRLVAHHRLFSLVVIDECFPPGTIVDGRPIESLRVGDMVTAFDPNTAGLASRRVVRVLQKTTASLWRIWTDRGMVTCTPRHKLWTSLGWVRASQLTAGCMIGHHAAADNDAMLRVSGSSDVDGQVSHRQVEAIWANVLHAGASGHMGLAGRIAANGGDEPVPRLKTNDGPQSYAAGGIARENETHATGDPASTEGTRRERATGTVAATTIGRSAGLADGSGGQNRQGLQAASLQDRHCEPGAESGDRSGRGQSRRARAPEAGRAEGRILDWARVESVEVLEPGGDGEFERVCPGGRVYDLEVEDLHTYIADGFAVSNCHHAAADTYRTTLVHLGFLPPSEGSEAESIEAPKYEDVAKMEAELTGWDAIAPQDRLLIGCTATPNRSDAIGLGCVFQEIAYSYALKEAIKDGWLVPIVPWVIETTIGLDAVKTTAGDFNQKQLAEAVNTNPRNKLAVAGWIERAKDLSTLAFTVDVAHAHALAGEFVSQGIEAVALSGETPKADRRQMLQSYTDGRIQVIANCMVLTEGTDLPRTGCILHAKPTKSATLYEQMTGRGLRLFEGKTACIVLDVVDVARRHSLQTAPVLYGLPPGLKADGKSLGETTAAFEAILEAHPGMVIDGRMSLAQLQARAVTFSVWDVRPMEQYGAGLKLNWLRTDDEAFRMNYPWEGGSETIAIEKDLLGACDVRVTSLGPRPTGGIAPVRSITTVSKGAKTAQEALRQAEAFVASQRPVALKIVASNAPWRRNPATDRQKALLARKKVPVPSGMTAGQASDILERIFNKR